MKIGDKVIPIKKTSGVRSIENSILLRKMRKENRVYAYVQNNNYEEEGTAIILVLHEDFHGTAEIFSKSDVIPYDGETSYMDLLINQKILKYDYLRLEGDSHE